MIGSLGFVLGAVPGTLVRATVNETDPTERVAAQAMLFQALPTNTGKVWVGLPLFDKGTTNAGRGVLGVVAAPADPTTGPFPSFSPSVPVIPSGLNAADFYIDADVAGDGVIVSFTAG